MLGIAYPRMVASDQSIAQSAALNELKIDLITCIHRVYHA